MTKHTHRLGPGSYNFHENFNTLHKAPCPSVFKINEKNDNGAGNYIYIGQSIVYDPEMVRSFPGGSLMRPNHSVQDNLLSS